MEEIVTTPIPGFPLEEYCKLHPRLVPKLDPDLVAALADMIVYGSPAASSGKKARMRLTEHLEQAKEDRDRGLPGSIRRAVRLWEELHGLDTTMVPA
jgi:hypothetical protein